MSGVGFRRGSFVVEQKSDHKVKRPRWGRRTLREREEGISRIKDMRKKGQKENLTAVGRESRA